MKCIARKKVKRKDTGEMTTCYSAKVGNVTYSDFDLSNVCDFIYEAERASLDRPDKPVGKAFERSKARNGWLNARI